MLSIIIPSRNEKFLNNTLWELLKKAEGEIEIIVVLDGYWTDPVDDLRVSYIHRGVARGMRHAINAAAAIAKGKYLMKIDAHCMVDQGFDVKLAENCEKNWVVIPRRKRLDADKWEIEIQHNGKPDVDYEYLSCPNDPGDWGGAGLHGKQWNDRSIERLGKEEYMIDDNMSFQGSCWFMHKSYFEFLELMDDTHYGIFANEAQEIGLKCWLSGGRVVTNKYTWYAHLHKGKKHGRGYHIAKSDLDKGNQFVNTWLSNSSGWKKQTLPLSWLIDHFSPVPSWIEDWKTFFPDICNLPPTLPQDGKN